MAMKYVLGLGEAGRSDIIKAAEVPTSGAIDLWINDTTPADLSLRDDPTEGRGFLHEPPGGGAIFRVVTFSKDLNDVTPEQMLKVHETLKSVHVPTLDELRAAKHPTMHLTETLNYFVLLSGKLWMMSEGRDVLLEPGDFAVQLGGMHGWRVEGEEPAVLACVLIDALPNA